MASAWTSSSSSSSSSSSLVHPTQSSTILVQNRDSSSSLSSIPETDSTTWHAICDECEKLHAAFFCVDCDLVYCDGCNALRHRKGKLRNHLRQKICVHVAPARVPHDVADGTHKTGNNRSNNSNAISPLSLSSNSSSSASSPASNTATVNKHAPATATTATTATTTEAGSESDIHTHVAAAVDPSGSPLQWTVDQVKVWMQSHELEAFQDEVDKYQIDGQFLFTTVKINHFLDRLSRGNRGLKKKLVREIHKVKSQGLAESESDQSSTPALAVTTQDVPSSSRHPGVNLRVQVDDHATVERLSSPVTALRSRITHGVLEEPKGRRVNRRMTSSASVGAGSSAGSIAVGMGIPPLQLESHDVVNAKRNKSFAMRPTLKIQIEDPHESPSINSKSTASCGSQLVHSSGVGLGLDDRHSDNDNACNDLRSARNALGALDLNITQVKREARAVASSYDFTAEGRLQTQGFDINTQGITTTPFTNAALPPSSYLPSSFTSASSVPTTTDAPASMPANGSRLGTREYLIMLQELGHGAGGKVYKALHVPTLKLLAVKVIRIYDQKKRHQMVRELRSLYANFVSIGERESKAACEELVVFYDAYTNPEIGSVSIVLEYMDHGSLEDLVQSKHKCSEKELANIAHDVLKGLAFLHEHHQLHRDIKLSNILINRKNKVKISDFGISRDLESTLAKATTFTGTLLYMAPERISGGMYSYPSDIWSFGLALMACAIGQLPVPTKDGYWGVVQAVQEQPSPRLSDYGSFSPSLCEFLDLCLQKNPMMRPPAVQLLEHRFLQENLVELEPSTLTAPQLAQQHQELDQIASQLASWYAKHDADPQLAGQQQHVWTMSRQERLENLANQLHLPLDTVVAKLKFLEKYHDEAIFS